MIHSSKPQSDTSVIGNSAEAFIEYYNENIPDTFPRATKQSLSTFQARYPSLFKKDGKWSIDKHRKKYMDWLVSHREQ